MRIGRPDPLPRIHSKDCLGTAILSPNGGKKHNRHAPRCHRSSKMCTIDEQIRTEQNRTEQNRPRTEQNKNVPLGADAGLDHLSAALRDGHAHRVRLGLDREPLGLTSQSVAWRRMAPSHSIALYYSATPSACSRVSLHHSTALHSIELHSIPLHTRSRDRSIRFVGLPQVGVCHGMRRPG